VIWSRILQLFHRNDHHIEATCHMQHLGCYLEGQWPCSRIVSGPKLCYLKSNFTTSFDKLLLCVQYRGALPGSNRLLLLSAFIFLFMLDKQFENIAQCKNNNTNNKILIVNNLKPTFGTFLIRCNWILVNKWFCFDVLNRRKLLPP